MTQVRWAQMHSGSLSSSLSSITRVCIRFGTPGNELWEGEPRAAFPDGYELLKPWIIHVQIKDFKRTAEGKAEAVRLGSGEVDYMGQLRALKADGYSGYLSLEIHWRVRREIPEDLLHRPKGSAFSFGGEEATRLCLQSLREILAQV